MCIADRSLSRLRGSPLPGAGCLGPEIRVGWGLFCLMRTSGPLISRWRVCPAGCCCGGFGRRCAFGLAAPLGLGLGAWVVVSRVCGYPARCCFGGFAAGALLGWLCRLGSAGCLACVSRWCVYPAGCCCGGCATGALLGWLCRLGLGWALGFCLAWVRLSCGGAGHVDAPQLCWTLPPLFSLANNRPLSEGAAGVSRLGERGISAIPYDFV